MFFLFILFSIYSCAKKECTQTTHSTFYNTNYGKPNVKFFIKETYNDNNPCEQITNKNFRDLHALFKNGNHVEHIVDITNSEPELSHCTKNIMGNLVLANSGWNQGVGQLCWDYVKIEKSQVYGDIFKKAMDNVKKCCEVDSTTTNQKTESPSSKNTPAIDVPIIILIVMIIILLVLLIVLGIICGSICFKRKEINHNDIDNL